MPKCFVFVAPTKKKQNPLSGICGRVFVDGGWKFGPYFVVVAVVVALPIVVATFEARKTPSPWLCRSSSLGGSW